MPRCSIAPSHAPVAAVAALAALAVPVAVALSLTAAGLAAPAGASEAGTAMVHVHGRLLVVAAEQPGQRQLYGVALADGEIVEVRGRFAGNARTGEVFDGLLAADPAALRLAGRLGQPLRVVGTPSVTPGAAAATPTVHQQFVAALDNEGALGQDDTQLLAHVSAVGSYWQTESNGAIAGSTVPSTVDHYDTALSTTDCGLGSDFFTVVEEAEQQFPDFSFDGSDQLVLFVPPSCGSGSVVGEGTVGSSFASGGALVVKAGDSIEGTYAHETGHNYGFEHANARVGRTSMEYYGVYDVMGFALPAPYNQLTALSTPYRVFQGITDPGEIKNVHPGQDNRAVRVAAVIRPRGDSSGLRSLRVIDPDTGEHLYLDYRSAAGEDAGAYYGRSGGASLSYSGGVVRYSPGVVVTAARAGSGVDDLVLDKAGDTALAAGTRWRDRSHALVVRVTRLDGDGAHVVVRYPSQTLASSRPVIHGQARVGRTLTAAHGHWTRGTTFHYAWYAGKVLLAHRSGRTLTLTRAQRGLRVRVRVTGTKRGYAKVSRTSATSSKVA
ncbi:MAG TPA: hypothetical protein VHW64_02770 [Nocardioides sp.]|uniref:hypothetical protein n=1 Tax=Nocardioides sp. TaxID=35761 RepID=UPI002E34CF34|nr:hypothetical protein [Nocardioides sp.]HEX3929601.1 hypothetical protein [Nocardioides sp.]